VFSLFDPSLNAFRRAYQVMTKLKVAAGMLALGLMFAATGENRAGDPTDTWASRLLAARFAETHQLICPQPGESRWREVPWQTSLWTARQIAAAEGKPMFVWSGSGGAPCAPT
jgi:hypothetical protein